MTNSTTPNLPILNNIPAQNLFKLSQHYTIPSGLPDEILNSLCEQCKSFEKNLTLSTILEKEIVDEKIRSSKHGWIHTDHWIAGVMAHMIRCANDNLFKFDLTEWASGIQYTVYDGNGSKYDWHTDTTSAAFKSDEVRKLSISLFLSDPDEYEGGELQILNVNKMHSYKAPKGTAVIFPSTMVHRVRPLKSGVRKSLVGWFGGPPWR